MIDIKEIDEIRGDAIAWKAQTKLMDGYSSGGVVNRFADTICDLVAYIETQNDEVDRLRETIMAVEYELDHPNDEMRSVIDRALKIITDIEKKP